MDKQCIGPGCRNVADRESEYCCKACEIALCENRILQTLPVGINSFVRMPSVPDENYQRKVKIQESKKQIEEIDVKLNEIRKKIEEIDIRIIRLIVEINAAKEPENFFAELNSDDSTSDCFLCGEEVQTKELVKHLEVCYMLQYQNIFIDQKREKPTDFEWNVFCNHKISKHLFCRKLRVLCPLHYKHFRKIDEVCGYEFGEKDGTKVFCGNIGRTCNHLNWEEIQRAELDWEKLKLVLKHNSLSEELKTKQELAWF